MKMISHLNGGLNAICCFWAQSQACQRFALGAIYLNAILLGDFEENLTF